MMDLVTLAFASLVLIVQNRQPDQHPIFDMATDEGSITISSTAPELKVVFSSPEFHESGSYTFPWDAGWTRVEVIRAGRKSVCEDGRKCKVPMGYKPLFDDGRGFSPDGKYLTIFVYNTVDPDGSDGKGYFTFLDLAGCRQAEFTNEHHVADPFGDHWKLDDPHTYMIRHGRKSEETSPPSENPKPASTEK